jgi:hypothetical protein
MDTTSAGLIATSGSGVNPTFPAQVASGTTSLPTVAVSEVSPQVVLRLVVVVTRSCVVRGDALDPLLQAPVATTSTTTTTDKPNEMQLGPE